MGFSSGKMAIAICDRCRMKRPYQDLGPDGNSPGLRVCSHGCRDPLDPWRLPARKTENITLAHPRPDASLAPDRAYIVTEDGRILISDSQVTGGDSGTGIEP